VEGEFVGFAVEWGGWGERRGWACWLNSHALVLVGYQLVVVGVSVGPSFLHRCDEAAGRLGLKMRNLLDVFKVSIADRRQCARTRLMPGCLDLPTCKSALAL
jgi:hypothetical protein